MTPQERFDFTVSSDFQVALQRLDPQLLADLNKAFNVVPKPQWRDACIEVVGRILALIDQLEKNGDDVSLSIKALVETMLDGPHTQQAVDWQKAQIKAVDGLIVAVKEAK
jgi:hypothetical protein